MSGSRSHWPSREQLLAICDSAQRLAAGIRKFARTTAPDSPARIHLAGEQTGYILQLLDEIDYLFHGRSLADYELDNERWSNEGWPISLARYVVGTPGTLEVPALAKFATDKSYSRLIGNNSNWPTPVESPYMAIFAKVAAIKYYFGHLPVFAINSWVSQGMREWMRERISCGGFIQAPESALTVWFGSEWWREIRYGEFPDGRHIRPPEFQHAGDIEELRAGGVPTAWLDALDYYSVELGEALSTYDESGVVIEFEATPHAYLRCPQVANIECQQYWNALWQERLKVFRCVLPWVRDAILALAGLQPGTPVVDGAKPEDMRAYITAHNKYSLGTNSKCDEVRDIHERQNREWQELTNVPPLGTPNDWWTAATLAGASPPADFAINDFERYAACIIAWALDRQGDAAQTQITDTKVPASVTTDSSPDATPFTGGEMVFYSDRVELCGVTICSGSRSASKRIVLDLLSRRRNGKEYVAYSGDDLEAKAKEFGAKGTSAGWVRDLRDDISERLLAEANIQCARLDVILSGDAGYRLSNRISVQFTSSVGNRDIRDIDELKAVPNVPNVPNQDVPNVPNYDVPNVLNPNAADVAEITPELRQSWIIQQISNGIRLKRADVVTHFKCTVKTAQRDLNALMDAKKIERVGSSRTGYYRLCAAPPNEQ